jgi:hypothetical protein
MKNGTKAIASQAFPKQIISLRKEAGCNEYISKPVRAGQLKALLQRYLA